MLNTSQQHELNNDQVYSGVDFRTNTAIYNNLLGSTVTIGSKVYTFGANWLLEKLYGGLTIPSADDLALSLVRAINGTMTVSPSTTNITANLGRADEAVEAYARGGMAYVVSRAGTFPTVSTNTGATITAATTPPNPFAGSGGGGGGGGPEFSTSALESGVASTSSSPVSVTIGKKFSVSNLSTTINLIVDNVFIIYPLMAESFYGSPTDHTIKSSAGSVNFQLKVYI